MRTHPWRARRQRPRLAAIQGNVLKGYGYDHARYVWIDFDDDVKARAWLERLEITSAEEHGVAKPDMATNIAFTAAGLARLGVPADVLDSFSEEFRDGMRMRSQVLGDVGPSDPRSWAAPFDRGTPDALLTLHGTDAAALAERAAALQADGVSVVDELPAAVINHDDDGKPNLREHFGFADGFSQPAFRGIDYGGQRPAAGNGVPLRFGRWRRLALGELVLGYVDEDHVYPEAPRGVLGRDGTYMVWRRLQQDVPAFRAWTRGAGGGTEDGARRVQAKIVGRWHNGTPLTLSPEAPVDGMTADGLNRIRYGRDDPLGLACPLGAHVRRANPRDGLGFGHRLTYRQRIVRRGMPYGDPLPEGAVDDADRGLVFVAYNANISRQFEVVQSQWLNDGRVFGLGTDRDPLTGGPQDDGKFVIQARPPQPPTLLAPLPQFVTNRGGAYLFVPSLPGIRALAAGTT